MRRNEVRVVLVPSSPRLDFVRDLPAPYSIHRVDGWADLRARLRTAPPSTFALVDADAPGGGLDGRVRELVERFSMNPVVGVVELEPGRVHDLRELVRWGVSEVVNSRTESLPTTVAHRLGYAYARPLKLRLEAVVPPMATHDGMTLLYAAAEVAVDCGGAPDLARRLGARPRTVAGWCARVGFPPPRRLQAWVRLLLAAALLEDPERTVMGAALACGYSTDHSLRRAMRELTGALPPRDRAFGAVAAAVSAELGRLSRERKHPPADD
ncbi:MAG TPA: helix-turn-helix domain-containing protein [Longimicrobiaceae bacterium]|nr:helix-turn-helix domain-containing protein [Longimicrobiaceae bacterium]